METAKAVPPRQGGKRIADRFASFLGAFEKAKREIVTGAYPGSAEPFYPLHPPN
nr:MAG TPA: hypothetical protein [Caudoviricetes sp.]